MDFTEWLTAWLSRHPLKSPSEAERSRFTDEVMARVRSDVASAAAKSWAHRLADAWPPLAVAAAVMVAVHVRHPAPARLASQLLDGTELLAEVDEPVNGWLLPEDPEQLAGDLEDEDLLVLAETPETTDASWLADTMDVLHQLDEDLPDEGASNEPTDDQWLQELQILDEQDLATRS